MTIIFALTIGMGIVCAFTMFLLFCNREHFSTNYSIMTWVLICFMWIIIGNLSLFNLIEHQNDYMEVLKQMDVDHRELMELFESNSTNIVAEIDM